MSDIVPGYGSPGSATTPHIMMEQIAKLQGINWINVPFKGGSEATNAILGGHVDAVADGHLGDRWWTRANYG